MTTTTPMMTRIFRPERFTGWHMLGVLGLFFGTIVAVNTVLAVFASGTWTGLVVKNSYVASQHYNEKLAEAERQARLGWQGTFDYDRGRAVLVLTGPDGGPVLADGVAATLRRPAFEQQDHAVMLTRVGPGRYALSHHLETGLWEADIAVGVAGGTAWRMTYRFTVTEEEQAR